MFKLLAILAAMVATVIFTVAYLTVSANVTSEPPCPTEDSCSIDYQDGRWTIQEEIP